MEYFRQRFDDYLAEYWPVTIASFSFDTAEVLRTFSRSDYDASFNEWIQRERQRSHDRAREFLELTSCLERFEALLHRLRSEAVVPFIGAGMSMPSGLPSWGAFITSMLADAPGAKQDVVAHVANGRFEEAAQLVHGHLGPDAFFEEIRNRLGGRHRKVAGPIALLPEIFRNEVITTNFDYILPSVYEAAGNRFVSEISGAALREAPNRLGEERHCLLRIHGEASSEIGRVLTLAEYDATYTQDRSLSALLGELSGARSFMFLGCSLLNDRTLAALREQKSNSPLGRAPHYAILALGTLEDRNARRRQLGEAGIHPIYYPNYDHDQSIEDLLICLADGEIR